MGLLWPRILEATPPVGYGGEKLARFLARRVTLEPAATGVSSLRKRFSSSLWILLALVGAVLLVACLNLANLTLARSAARRHESGVRSALGASALDLIKEPLIEAFLLAVPGALLGLGVAYWASQELLQVAWTGIVATSLSTAPDWRVLAFTAGIALASGLLFAAAPAWSAAHTDPLEALRQQTRSVRGGSMALGKTLLVAQMALSLMLVAGALLFGQTLNRLYTIDVGYRRDHLLTMLLFPQPGHRATPSSAAYYRQLAESMQRLPGVASASFSNSAPANEYEFFSEVYPSLNASPLQAVSDSVGPDFFRVAGMHVLAGREFNWRDDGHDPPKNVIVSQSLARKLFGDGDAVDQIIYLGPHARAVPVKIVGVVNSASLWKVESVQPMALYVPLDFGEAGSSPLMVIRTATDPRSIKTEAERVVRSLGNHYSLRTATVEERLDTFLSVQRLTAILAAFFGAVALLIASIGLYGLMSFFVNRRTAELGVRLALGAQPRQVLSMVLREVLALAACGCALGVAGSLLAARLIKSILFGVSATDPVILAAAAFSLVGVALVAGFVPARRAAGVDPAVALRAE
jgi:predicted permease